jgi:uncharacterized protein
VSAAASRFGLQRSVVALLTGVVFGLGLAVAGMTDPNKVLAFLDITGRWDPSLLFVLGGAVVLCFFGFRWILRRERPVYGTGFSLPSRTDIDGHLVYGALMFGVGWGLAGYCPGPALASVGFGNAEALWFLPAMFAGMFARRYMDKRAKLKAVQSELAPQA